MAFDAHSDSVVAVAAKGLADVQWLIGSDDGSE